MERLYKSPEKTDEALDELILFEHRPHQLASNLEAIRQSLKLVDVREKLDRKEKLMRGKLLHRIKIMAQQHGFDNQEIVVATCFLVDFFVDYPVQLLYEGIIRLIVDAFSRDREWSIKAYEGMLGFFGDIASRRPCMDHMYELGVLDTIKQKFELLNTKTLDGVLYFLFYTAYHEESGKRIWRLGIPKLVVKAIESQRGSKLWHSRGLSFLVGLGHPLAMYQMGLPSLLIRLGENKFESHDQALSTFRGLAELAKNQMVAASLLERDDLMQFLKGALFREALKETRVSESFLHHYCKVLLVLSKNPKSINHMRENNINLILRKVLTQPTCSKKIFVYIRHISLLLLDGSFEFAREYTDIVLEQLLTRAFAIGAPERVDPIVEKLGKCAEKADKVDAQKLAQKILDTYFRLNKNNSSGVVTTDFSKSLLQSLETRFSL